jgi:hypothetical protein
MAKTIELCWLKLPSNKESICFDINEFFIHTFAISDGLLGCAKLIVPEIIVWKN